MRLECVVPVAVEVGGRLTIELKRALQQHERREAVVIPIIVRPCGWDRAEPPISKSQAVPNNGKALTGWNNFPDGIHCVLEEIF